MKGFCFRNKCDLSDGLYLDSRFVTLVTDLKLPRSLLVEQNNQKPRQEIITGLFFYIDLPYLNPFCNV